MTLSAPIFSALKKDGKRLYEYARKGEHLEIPKRAITINEFKITNIDMPNVEFQVVCSKGTYIRSLAHDFGKMLNNGAHLSSLRRTKIGDFSVDNAVGVLAFEKAFKAFATSKEEKSSLKKKSSKGGALLRKSRKVRKSRKN